LIDQVDAIDYYGVEEKRLEEEIENEKINAFQDCTGIAFIVFQTEHMAHRYSVSAFFLLFCKAMFYLVYELI